MNAVSMAVQTWMTEVKSSCKKLLNVYRMREGTHKHV